MLRNFYDDFNSFHFLETKRHIAAIRQFICYGSIKIAVFLHSLHPAYIEALSFLRMANIVFSNAPKDKDDLGNSFAFQTIYYVRWAIYFHVIYRLFSQLAQFCNEHK